MLSRSFYNYAFPWQEFEHLRRAFGRPRIRVASRFPALNVWTNEEGVTVTAKLPGLDPEDIDISVKGEFVTVSGSRKSVELEDNEQYLRRERRYGDFSRTFQLPFAINADSVEASFENGILHISLPRAEEDKPKKIAVKSAQA